MNPRNVLVVDDDQFLLDTTCEVLAARGFRVARACSTEAALLLLEGDFIPDVILTDLNMPGRSGEELAESVRADPRCHDTAIIAMSACSRTLERARAKVDAKLLKPFDLPVLLQAIARAWAMRLLPL